MMPSSDKKTPDTLHRVLNAIGNSFEFGINRTRDFIVHVYLLCYKILPSRLANLRSFRTIFAGFIFFVIALTIAVIGKHFISTTPGKILLCLGAALLGTEIAFFLVRKLNRNWMRNILFVSIFTWGIITYLQLSRIQEAASREAYSIEQRTEIQPRNEPEDMWDILLSGCQALASFFPSRGGYDTVDSQSYSYPGYVLFHITAYVFFVYFALMIWGERVCNRIMNFWTLDQHKYVFWCKSIDAKIIYLAENIKERDAWARIVISVSEKENKDKTHLLFREANYYGYVLKLRRMRQIHTDCLNARKHFFLTDNSNWNVRKAQAFLGRRKRKPTSSYADLYIMTGNDDVNTYFQMWADKVHAESALTGDKSRQVEIHLVNESELVAREFIEAYPMLKCPGIEIDPKTATVRGKFRTLLIGFGEHGWEILRHIVEDGQFVHRKDETDKGPDFSVDIFDKEPNRLGSFFKCYPDANRYCNMDLEHLERYRLDVFSGEFHDFLVKNLGKYNRIVICLGDDNLGLNMASRIENIAKQNDICLQEKLFVFLKKDSVLFTPRESDSVAKCLDISKADHERSLIAIGDLKDIFTCDNILETNGIIETAKLINLMWLLDSDFNVAKIMKSGKPLLWLATKQEAYSYYDLPFRQPQGESSKTAPVEYRILSHFNRQSSIASARGYRNIALLLNPSLTPDEAARTAPPDAKGELLETLAETEHKRWNAFHFMRGIKLWPIKDIPPEATLPNDILHHLRHAALVDYSELDSINQRFGLKDGRTMQSYDRRIVENIRIIRGVSNSQQETEP